MTNSLKIAIAATSSALVLSASAAFACSENLYRVGHGVQFRQYTAPIPGNVLVIAKTSSEREFAEWLASTGHMVEIVEDPSVLGESLNKHEYDVILGYFSDREDIEAQRAASTNHAVFIPVTTAGSADEVLAKALYKRSLSSGADEKAFLKAIHQSIKLMSRAQTKS